MKLPSLFGRNQTPPTNRRTPPRFSKRAYDAATKDRQTFSWELSHKNADGEIRMVLPILRNASRELERNDGYARSYLGRLTRNVVGPKGILLQARSKGLDGELDKADNAAIEKAYKKWGNKKNCTVAGTLSWLSVQQALIRTVARDGEAIIRMIKGKGAGNPFHFALQIFEADHLDETYCEDLRNGNRIWMGVEYNSYGKPLFYHLLAQHPGADTYNRGGRRYIKIPAEEILHPFVVERFSQSRGVPWMTAAAKKLHMLSAYERAELVAARTAAIKMGFYEATDPEAMPDGFGQAADEGEFIDRAEEGTFEIVPQGYSLKTFDPQHPNSAFPDFRKSMLRGASAGLQVSYNGLGADLENVNYSSLRQGALDERDEWRLLQHWMIENVHQEIYENWLSMALLTPALPLPFSKFEKFLEVEWQPRGWSWVDPLKEVQAGLMAVNGGIETLRNIVAERGGDLEENFKITKADNDLAKSYGLNFDERKADAKGSGPPGKPDQDED